MIFQQLNEVTQITHDFEFYESDLPVTRRLVPVELN